jgi:hypothetical protein
MPSPAELKACSTLEEEEDTMRLYVRRYLGPLWVFRDPPHQKISQGP